MSIFTKIGGLGKATRTDFDPRSDIPASDVQAAIEYLRATIAGLSTVYQPLDSDLTAIAALTTTAYGRSLLTLANATALAAEVDSFFLTPAEGNAAYQPLDSDLTAIAALTTATYGRSLLTLANATALAAEVDGFFLTPAEGNAAYQPLDSDLTAIAALTTTTFGRSLLTFASAALTRAALGLDTGDSPTFAGVTATATAALNGTVSYGGIISPAQLTSNTNDWAPTGLSAASVIRFSTDASRDITGLTGGASGRLVIMHNVGSFAGVLKNSSGSSSATNQFLLSADITLNSNQTIELQYDSTTQRWRAIGGTASGGAVSVSADDLTTSIPAFGMVNPINAGVAASVGSSALTVALKGADGNDPSASNPVLLAFRSATAATGTPVIRSITGALSLVISSGSTMGTSNSVAFALWLVAFDDGGTIRLGLVNCVNESTTVRGVYALGAYPLVSSTAEGGAGAADSAQVIYTGSAVTTKAYVIIARLSWESGLGTAGTWSAGPTRIEMFQPGMRTPGQVVQIITSSGSSTLSASTTMTNVTNSTLAPTLISAANLVDVHYAGGTRATAGGAGVNSESTVQIALGGSVVGLTHSVGVVSGAGTNFLTDGAVSLRFLSKPNSTSPSYTCQHKCLNASHNVTTDVIGIAMEIQA